MVRLVNRRRVYRRVEFALERSGSPQSKDEVIGGCRPNTLEEPLAAVDGCTSVSATSEVWRQIGTECFEACSLHFWCWSRWPKAGRAAARSLPGTLRARARVMTQHLVRLDLGEPATARASRADVVARGTSAPRGKAETGLPGRLIKRRTGQRSRLWFTMLCAQFYRPAEALSAQSTSQQASIPSVVPT